MPRNKKNKAKIFQVPKVSKVPKVLKTPQVFCDNPEHGIMRQSIFADYGDMKVYMLHCVVGKCIGQSLIYSGSINLHHLIKAHHTGRYDI